MISPKVYLHTFDRYSQTNEFEAQNEAYVDKFERGQSMVGALWSGNFCWTPWDIHI